MRFDHPLVHLLCPAYVVARALFAAGDNGEATAVQQELLALWKDGDADAPVVHRAKAMHTKARAFGLTVPKVSVGKCSLLTHIAGLLIALAKHRAPN